MLVSQKNALNVRPGTAAQLVVHVSQGDTGSNLEFYLYNGSEPYEPDGVAIALEGMRKTGTGVGPIACTYVGNLVTVQTTAEMTAEAGPVLCELIITDGSGESIGTANFAILVEEATFPDGPIYNNSVDVYSQILAYVQTIPASVDESVNARIAVEKVAREAADTVMQTNIANLQSGLASETSARTEADALLQTEIDNIIAPSGEAPSAAEVQNARIGADGTVYDTLGNAIRGQVTDLKSAFEREKKIIPWVGSDWVSTKRKDIQKVVDYYYSNSNNALVYSQGSVCYYIEGDLASKKFYVASGVTAVTFDIGGTKIGLVSAANDSEISGQKSITLQDNAYSGWFNLASGSDYLIDSASMLTTSKNGYSEENMANKIECPIDIVSGANFNGQSATSTKSTTYVASSEPFAINGGMAFVPKDNTVYFSIINKDTRTTIKDLTNDPCYIYSCGVEKYSFNARKSDSSIIKSVEEFLEHISITEISNEWKGMKWVYGSGYSRNGRTITISPGNTRLITYGIADKSFTISCLDDGYEFYIYCFEYDTMKQRYTGGGRHANKVEKGDFFIIQFKENSNTAFNLTADIDTILGNKLSIKEIGDFDTGVAIPDYQLLVEIATATINGAYSTDEVNEESYALVNNDTYAHAGSILVIGEYAYVSMIENNVTHVENDDYTCVHLVKFPLSDPTDITDYKVAGKGTYHGVTFSGRCSVPNIMKHGTYIEYYFGGLINDEVNICHTTFDTESGTFEDITVCGFRASSADNYIQMNATNLNKYLMDPSGTCPVLTNSPAFIPFGNYATLTVGTDVQYEGIPVLMYSADYNDYDVVNIEYTRTRCDAEAQLYIFGGYLYIAYRAEWFDQIVTVVKYEMSNFTIIDKMTVRDCADRPWFFEIGDDLYFVHQKAGRNFVEIIKINTAHLKGSTIASSINVWFGVGMPSLVYDSASGKVLMVGQGEKNTYKQIFFERFTPFNYSKDQVKNKLLQFFA